MREDYGRAFASMYTGSMRGSGFGVYAVWNWVIAHKDENGLLEINPDRVADELGESTQEVVAVLQSLQRPDPESRSKMAEGARIVHVDGEQFLFQVVNHEKYMRKGNNRTEYWREYKRKKRREDVLKRVSTVDNSVKVDSPPKSTHVDVDVDVLKTTTPPKKGDGAKAKDFQSFWDLYAQKENRKASEELWRKLVVKPGIPLAKVLDGVKRYLQTDKVRRGYQMNPARWLGGARWDDEIEAASGEVEEDSGTRELTEEEADALLNPEAHD